MAKQTKKPILEPLTYRVGPEAHPHVYREDVGLFKVGEEFDWPERAPVIDQPSLKLEPMTQRAYDKQVAFHGPQNVFGAWPDSEFGPGASDPEVIEAEKEALAAQEAAAVAAQKAHEAAGNAALARRNRRIAAGVEAGKADAKLAEAELEAGDELEAAEAEFEKQTEKLEDGKKQDRKPKDRKPKQSKSGRASDNL